MALNDLQFRRHLDELIQRRHAESSAIFDRLAATNSTAIVPPTDSITLGDWYKRLKQEGLPEKMAKQVAEFSYDIAKEMTSPLIKITGDFMSQGFKIQLKDKDIPSVIKGFEVSADEIFSGLLNENKIILVEGEDMPERAETVQSTVVKQEVVNADVKDIKMSKGVKEYLEKHGQIQKVTKKDVVLGDRIHEVMSWWQEGIRLSKMGYLLMGKSLYHLKKEKLWRQHIEHMPSFKYWVENELHISVAQAHRLSQIYEEVGAVINDMSIDVSKITLLLPYLHGKTDEEKKQMLEMANGCTIEDIKNNIKEMNGEPHRASDVCTHEETEVFVKCKNCGKWLRNE